MNGGKMTLAEAALALTPSDEIRGAVERDARVREMVDRWRHRLNLTNWDIRFDPSQGIEAKDDAHVYYADAQQAAVVAVNEKLDGQAAELCVVHELLHTVLHEWSTQAARLLVHVKDDVSRVHLQEMLNDAEERAIEDISRALVPGPRVLLATMKPGAAKTWEAFR